VVATGIRATCVTFWPEAKDDARRRTGRSSRGCQGWGKGRFSESVKTIKPPPCIAHIEQAISLEKHRRLAESSHPAAQRDLQHPGDAVRSPQLAAFTLATDGTNIGR
jgi:hypothetical protein